LVNEGLKEVASDFVMKLKYGTEGMLSRKASLSSIKDFTQPLSFVEFLP